MLEDVEDLSNQGVEVLVGLQDLLDGRVLDLLRDLAHAHTQDRALKLEVVEELDMANVQLRDL